MKFVKSFVLFFMAILLTPQPLHAHPNSSEVCMDAGFESAASTSLIDRKIIETESTLEILVRFVGRITASWGLYLAPRLEARLAAYATDRAETEDFIRKMTGREMTIEEALGAAASRPAAYSPESIRRFQEYFTTGLKDEYGERLQQVRKIAPAICLQYAVPGCAKALRRVIGLEQPFVKDAYNLSLFPILIEVFTDPSYVQGAAIAALRMNGRIALAIAGTRTPGALFDDVLDGYLQAGFSRPSAEEHAWNLLAVYSTRGPVLGFTDDFSNSENHALIVSLHVINMAAGVIDMRSENGDRYSLPREVRSECAYGKPYHFWLPAYLSRTLVNEGFSRRSSALASHLAGMMYEMFSKTSGRDPERPFKEPLHSTYSDSLRLNLIYNDAGAVYGAYPARRIDTDRAMRSLLDEARPLSEKDIVRLKNADPKYAPAFFYHYWRKLFSPDSGFKSMLRD